MAVRTQHKIAAVTVYALVIALLVVFFPVRSFGATVPPHPVGYRVIGTFVDDSGQAYVVDTNTKRDFGMVAIDQPVVVKAPLGTHPIIRHGFVPMFRTRWGWISGTLYFNKTETRLATSTALLVWMAANFLPPPFGQLIPAYAAWISSAATIAMAHNRCLEIKSHLAVLDYAGRWCR